MIKIFLNFIEQISRSEKNGLKTVLNVIKKDTRSITGNNLRQILLLIDKTNIDDLCSQDALSIEYKEVPENEEWRIPFVKELINIRHGDLKVDGFSVEELAEILNDICIS